MAKELVNSIIEGLKVCVDCYLGINGYSEEETGDEGIGVAMNRLYHNWQDHDVVPDNGDTDPHFSMNNCDGCGSTLAGDRYYANAYPRQ